MSIFKIKSYIKIKRPYFEMKYGQKQNVEMYYQAKYTS